MMIQNSKPFKWWGWKWHFHAPWLLNHKKFDFRMALWGSIFLLFPTRKPLNLSRSSQVELCALVIESYRCKEFLLFKGIPLIIVIAIHAST